MISVCVGTKISCQIATGFNISPDRIWERSQQDDDALDTHDPTIPGKARNDLLLLMQDAMQPARKPEELWANIFMVNSKSMIQKCHHGGIESS